MVLASQTNSETGPPVPDLATWSCRIGQVPHHGLPDWSDRLMREAVARAYREITGEEPLFIFSGWADELTESERAVLENRKPTT
jgi:hypothetical protein